MYIIVWVRALQSDPVYPCTIFTSCLRYIVISARYCYKRERKQKSLAKQLNMGKQYGDGAVLPFRNVSSIRSCHQIIFQHIMVPIVLAALTTRDSFCYIRMNRTIRVSLGRGRNIKVLYHCACTLEVACITWILLPCHKICVISM